MNNRFSPPPAFQPPGANSRAELSQIAEAIRSLGDISLYTAEQIGSALYAQTPAELAAAVTPTYYQYEPGDVRRYGWLAANTGAQNATALSTAASVWSNGGPKIRIPAGTFSLSQFVVPAGRGLIIEGEGPTKTELVHSAGGAMFVLGADNIQMFSLRDMQIEASATSTVLLDWSGDYQAYNFNFYNVELHQGASGNTTCTAFQIVGGTDPVNEQKHYFTWFGGKIFGLGTGFKLDGSVGAAANDFTAVGFQMQGQANDGILVQDSGNNFFRGSIENCGDGATYFNYRIMGSVSSENFFHGRLENTITPANVPFYIDPAAGFSNQTYATLSATPAGYNDVMAVAGCVLYDNGRELSKVEERQRGLRRVLGAATTDYLLRFALHNDTMGGFGRFGVRADGQLSWADGTNPSAYDVGLYRSGVGALEALGGVANRVSNQGNVTGAVAVNCANGWTHRLVLTGNVTIDAPTNPASGAVLRFVIVQNGAGGHTVGFDTIFELAGGAYTMTPAASARDTISFVYDSTSALWCEVSRSQALA